MIKRHSTRNSSGTVKRAVMPVQGDSDGERRNGMPGGVYLPGNPGRRYRLLRALGYALRNTPDDTAVELTTQWRDAT